MIWWLLGAGSIAVIVAVIGATIAIRRLFAALPKPETFAEGQRLIFGWLAAFAGIFCGAMAEQMVALLMWGGWAPEHERTIIVIFGWSLGGFIAAMCLVIIGLMVGGPVGRFGGKIGKDGLEWEAGKDHEKNTKVDVNVRTDS